MPPGRQLLRSSPTLPVHIWITRSLRAVVAAAYSASPQVRHTIALRVRVAEAAARLRLILLHPTYVHRLIQVR